MTADRRWRALTSRLEHKAREYERHEKTCALEPRCESARMARSIRWVLAEMTRLARSRPTGTPRTRKSK